jgi:hypothetical protein
MAPDPQPRRRLTKLQVDEISCVPSAANEHSRIIICKAHRDTHGKSFDGYHPRSLDKRVAGSGERLRDVRGLDRGGALHALLHGRDGRRLAALHSNPRRLSELADLVSEASTEAAAKRKGTIAMLTEDQLRSVCKRHGVGAFVDGVLSGDVVVADDWALIKVIGEAKALALTKAVPVSRNPNELTATGGDAAWDEGVSDGALNDDNDEYESPEVAFSKIYCDPKHAALALAERRVAHDRMRCSMKRIVG